MTLAANLLERFIVNGRVMDHGKVDVEQAYLQYL